MNNNDTYQTPEIENDSKFSFFETQFASNVGYGLMIFLCCAGIALMSRGKPLCSWTRTSIAEMPATNATPASPRP